MTDLHSKTFEYQCSDHARPIHVTVSVPVSTGTDFLDPTWLTCPYCHGTMHKVGQGDSRNLSNKRAEGRTRRTGQVAESVVIDTPETRTAIRLLNLELQHAFGYGIVAAVAACIRALHFQVGLTYADGATRTWNEAPDACKKAVERFGRRRDIQHPDIELRALQDEYEKRLEKKK